MYAALWIPEFPLQALIRPRAARWTESLAVLDDLHSIVSPGKARKKKAPVIALNHAARSRGVLLGMTATQGQARCAGLTLFTRDREAEREAQENLLEAVSAFTPDYEDTEPGLCVADLFGVGHLQGREENLGRQIRESLQRAHGLEAQVGLATTPDLAVLAARMAAGVDRRGGKVSVKMLPAGPGKALVEMLAREPIAYLEPPASVQEILQGWGIRHIGSFLNLPRAEVSRRLGQEAALLWDKVSGNRRRLLALVRAPVEYRQSYHFEYEVEQLEPLLFVVRRLLETLAARLVSAYLVAKEVELILLFADGKKRTEPFRIPDPTADADLLFRIIHTRLEQFVAESPVAAITMTLQPARPKKRQFDLFQSVLRDPNRFEQTLARLEALLGSDRVGNPGILDTHRPDAFVMQPFEEVLEEAAEKKQRTRSRVMESKSGLPLDEETAKTFVSSSFLLGLPLRRFRPPRKIRVETARTSGGYAAPVRIEIGDGSPSSVVSQSRGPWKSSGHWWETQRMWKREEWDVQLADGRLYRLAREAKAWILEGEYG